MTRRLYYDDAYLSEFGATIERVRRGANGYELTLDQSAFYPTSGGQPHDTGMIGELAVTDVFVEDGEVWHAVVGEPREGEAVRCTLHWARRFDHMQQHGGEHLLAGAVWRQLGGVTIGLHVGAEDSTIDVAMPNGLTHLGAQQLDALEDEVNAHIQSDAACRCWFPEPDELARLPLRKPPTVADHVRVVAFGDFEMVACGGTHPLTAGQIGLIKIADARPSKGKLRLSFLCGARALRDYRSRMKSGDRAAALLSVQHQMLPEAVVRLIDEASALSRELMRLRRQAALAGIPALLEGAKPLPDGALLVTSNLPGLAPDALREVASKLTEGRAAIALLASDQESGCILVFARSAGIALDMGQLMREATGGKGGGRPDFAQGGAPDAEAIDIAARIAAASILKLRYQN